MNDIAQIRRALAWKTLKFPRAPKIDDVRIELAEDATGGPGLAVTVILAEKTADKEFEWEPTRPIEEAIRQRLYAKGIELWPHFTFAKASELPPQATSSKR